LGSLKKVKALLSSSSKGLAMSDKFVVFNPTHSNISLRIGLPVDESVSSMAQHHQRKIVRGSFINVNVKPQSSADLAQMTALSAEQLKMDTEVSRALRLHNLIHFNADLPIQETVKPLEKKIETKPFKAEKIEVPVVKTEKVIEEPVPSILESLASITMPPMPVSMPAIPEEVIEDPKAKKKGIFSSFKGKAKA
jgi:hypothetical protein